MTLFPASVTTARVLTVFRKTLVSLLIVAVTISAVTANFGWNWSLYAKQAPVNPVERWTLWTFWLARCLGSVTGADNSWQMFSTLHRINFRIEWQGLPSMHSDDSPLPVFVFPLPRQSERSPIDAFVFDARYAKFELNQYSQDWLRAGFAKYLCHRFQNQVPGGFSAVRVVLVYSDINPPPWREGERTTQPVWQTHLLGEYPCR